MKLTALAIAVAAVVAAAGNAAAQTVSLKFQSFVPPKSGNWTGQLAPWMDKVEADSAGAIKFERFPAMQLGGTPANLVDQVRDGVVDAVWTLPGYTAGRFPRSEAFELPFMLTNAEATSRALWEYMSTVGADDLKEYHVIATHVHPPGFFHSRDKEIRSIADLRGMKVRGATRLSTRLLASLGATPVGMPVTQVADALSKGVVDAVILPWEVVPAFKVQELVKSHSEFDPKLGSLYTSTFVVLMNKAKYASLPPAAKKAIDMNSGPDESARHARVMGQNDLIGKKLSQERGNKMLVFGAAETEAFRKASDLVDDEWIKEANGKGLNGKMLVDTARALIQKHSK
jgi:TRAP-type transport system periplasmic protein